MGGLDASAAAEVVRVGFLQAEAPNEVVDAFKAGMRDLGYSEGRNLVIEERWAKGNLDNLPRLAKELVDLRVNIIVTGTTPALIAASNATKTVPIVIGSSADPAATGLVASLARPGGNITGLTIVLDDLCIKRLEILKELVPSVRRVAVLWSSSNPVWQRMITKMEQTAPRLGMRIEQFDVRRPDSLQSTLNAIAARKPDALYVFEDPILNSHVAQIQAFALRNRLPTLYGRHDYVRDGGLVSYAADFEDMYRRAAGFVDRILKGADPAVLPIEQPTKFNLAVNVKTARALNITIPESIMLRATEVIQ